MGPTPIRSPAGGFPAGHLGESLFESSNHHLGDPAIATLSDARLVKQAGPAKVVVRPCHDRRPRREREAHAPVVGGHTRAFGKRNCQYPPAQGPDLVPQVRVRRQDVGQCDQALTRHDADTIHDRRQRLGVDGEQRVERVPVRFNAGQRGDAGV
jgi:hypothetical protein